MTTTKCFAVKGLRLGVKLTIPDTRLKDRGGARHVINGEISDEQALQYLRSAGYELEECDGVPKFDEAAVAERERNVDKVVSKDANAERARIAERAADVQFGRVQP